MATGFLYDSRFLNHLTGSGHPECPERLSVTMNHLKTLAWYPQLVPISPQTIDDQWLRTIHTQDFLKRAKSACQDEQLILDTPDVRISPESYHIARLAAGGALTLADEIIAGNIHNGFALLRPPGHHAEKSQALGFCLINNIAVLARYFQKKHGLEKILILDWDVHHGNGTQHVFEEDASVLYISLHQYPFYPGTGSIHEEGKARGKGATLNCPMRSGATDENYVQAFGEKILPKIHSFKPDVILISAGFDAHTEDPLGGVCLSTEMFGWMSERMMEVADQYCQGRILSLLEGGYNLEVLPRCVEKHLEVMLLGKSLP